MDLRTLAKNRKAAFTFIDYLVKWPMSEIERWKKFVDAIRPLTAIMLQSYTQVYENSVLRRKKEDIA